MNLEKYLSRPELGFDLLRVYLGIGLVVRGGLIAGDPAVLERFIGNADWLWPMAVAHAVVLSHLLGGGLLALGYLTRWAAAIQVPTVAGALFLVHWNEGLFARTQSAELAALVLVALVLYTMFGAGELSVDSYIQRMRVKRQERPLVPELTELPHGSRAAEIRAAERRGAELRAAELRALAPRDEASSEPPGGPDLAVAPDSPRVRQRYRDTKAELAILLTMTCVLFVLLAKGFYVAATAWVIVSVFMFGIWRIGRAQFQ
jgi:putative oxidoreductase